MPSTFPVFDPVSSQVESSRNLFVEVLISGGIFPIVTGLICVALRKLRNRDEFSKQDFGSHRELIGWIAGPVIIVLWTAAIRIKLILTRKALPPQDAHADTDSDFVVTGHQ